MSINAVTVQNGIITINAFQPTECSEGYISSGQYGLRVCAETGESVNEWAGNDNATINTGGGNQKISGNNISAYINGIDEESIMNCAVSTETTNSSIYVQGNNVAVQFGDCADGNELSALAANEIDVFLENSWDNIVTAEAQDVNCFAGDYSFRNAIDAYGYGSNTATISGYNNVYFSNYDSTINIGANAEGTIIMGTNYGTDILNDKAGADEYTSGNTIYFGGYGDLKANLMGNNALIDARYNNSLEVNYMSSNSQVFTSDNAESDGTNYNFNDYLRQHICQQRLADVYENSALEYWFSYTIDDRLNVDDTICF